MDNLLKNGAKTEEGIDVVAYEAGLRENYGHITRGEFADLVEASPLQSQFLTLMQIWDEDNKFDFDVSDIKKYDRLRLTDEVSKQINLQASNTRATQEINQIISEEAINQVESLIDRFMLEFRANSELFDISFDKFDMFTLHIVRFSFGKQTPGQLIEALKSDNFVREGARPSRILQFAMMVRINAAEIAA